MSFYQPLKAHFQSQLPDLDMKVLENDLIAAGCPCTTRPHKEGFFIDCKKQGLPAIFAPSIALNFFRKPHVNLMSITYTPTIVYRFIGMMAILGLLASTIFFNYESWVLVFKNIMWLIYGLSYLIGEELIPRLRAKRFNKLFLKLRDSFESMPAHEFYAKLNDENRKIAG